MPIELWLTWPEHMKNKVLNNMKEITWDNSIEKLQPTPEDMLNIVRNNMRDVMYSVK